MNRAGKLFQQRPGSDHGAKGVSEMATEIITLAQARAQGLSRYFTGIPCKRGHLAERIVSKACCVICERENNNRWREENREKLRENNNRWREENREKLRKQENERKATLGPTRDKRLARRREWRQENKERLHKIEAERYEKNKEKLREAAKRSYHKDFEKGRARVTKWRDENLDKRQKYLDEIGRQKSKEWRDTHREYLQEYQDEYRKKFSEKFREQYLLDRRRRRAREVGAEGNHTAAEAFDILVSQNYRCAYCDADLRQVKRHLDHVMPLSRGGSNDKSNLQWLCELHNLQKSDKDPVEYERSIGFVR